MLETMFCNLNLPFLFLVWADSSIRTGKKKKKVKTAENSEVLLGLSNQLDDKTNDGLKQQNGILNPTLFFVVCFYVRRLDCHFNFQAPFLSAQVNCLCFLN